MPVEESHHLDYDIQAGRQDCEQKSSAILSPVYFYLSSIRQLSYQKSRHEPKAGTAKKEVNILHSLTSE